MPPAVYLHNALGLSSRGSDASLAEHPQYQAPPNAIVLNRHLPWQESAGYARGEALVEQIDPRS